MTDTAGAGSLTAAFGEPDTAFSTVYLKTANGAAIGLITNTAAERQLAKLVRLVTDVNGSADTGFSWTHHGSIPLTKYCIRPLAAPHMPFGGLSAIELWFPLAGQGDRLVRRFSAWLPDAMTLYLAGCCLWSMRDTGADAETAVIYGPDGMPFRIDKATWACGKVSACYLLLLRNSETTFRSANPPPA